MPRPYKHPKTGIYWLRQVVPAPIRATLGRTEFKASLKTRDPTEAKLAAGPVLAGWSAQVTAARNGTARPSQRQIDEAVAALYRAEVHKHTDNPGRSYAGVWVTP